MKRKITDEFNRIKDDIGAACERVKLDPAHVRLVAVTDSVGPDVIHALLELGQVDFGQSDVQSLIQHRAVINEMVSRVGLLGAGRPDAEQQRTRWHMVGGLHRSKVRQLLPVVNVIHSVDSLRLAEEINTCAAKLGLHDKVGVFLQVDATQHKRHCGLAVGAVGAMVEQVATLPNLQIMGLMTQVRSCDDTDELRFCVVRCRELFEEIFAEKVAGAHFQYLSADVGSDYVAAVEAGATMILCDAELFQ